jgi:hypothetical protein
LSLECVGYTDSRPGSQIIPPGLPIHVPDRGDFIGIVGNTDSGRLKTCLEAAVHEHAPNLKAVGLLVPENGYALPANPLKRSFPVLGCRLSGTLGYGHGLPSKPNYHRSSDRIETLDFPFMRDLAQAVVALPEKLAQSV